MPRRSTPMFMSSLVRMPCAPIVAMNANASGTPPSCEATADQESRVECSHRGRSRLLIVSARRMPTAPPMNALVAEMAIEFTKPSR